MIICDNGLNWFSWSMIRFYFKIIHLQPLVINIKTTCLKLLSLNKNISNIYFCFCLSLQTTCLIISYHNLILIKIKIEKFFFSSLMLWNKTKLILLKYTLEFISKHCWIKLKTFCLKHCYYYLTFVIHLCENDNHNLFKSFHENHGLPIWILFVTSLKYNISINATSRIIYLKW